MKDNVSVKVSELKPGMLLRFKEPRIYKYLRDSGDDYWMDVGHTNPKVAMPHGEFGQPLMIYLGQTKMDAPSHYGGFVNVREVSVDGRKAWMWPDAWKYVEVV